MEKDNVSGKKSKGRFIRWMKRAFYLFILLFVIVDFFFFFLATPLLKSYLQQKVGEQTSGLFSVDFDKISIELGSRRLVLQNFELTPDTVVYNKMILEKKTEAALYKISCKSVELWRIRPYRLFVKGKLKASSLNLVNPVVELKKLPANANSKTESRDFVHEDLFPAIEPYVAEIELDKTVLDNGKFLLSLKKDSTKTTTHIGNISVTLYHFFLNRQEHLKRQRLFFSDDIQLEVEDYRINLSDNVHYLFADQLTISTKKSKLFATNVGINTKSEKKEFIGNLKSNYYRISAPIIEFKNFDVTNLYFNNDIKIGSVTCYHPNIEIVNKLVVNARHAKNAGKSMEINLYELLAGKLRSVAIDTFSINDGHLKFFYQSWFTMPAYKAGSVNLNCFNFLLNDKSNNIKSKIFYSDNIQLKIDSLTAILPDKSHLVQVSNAEISSQERIVNAKGIAVKKRFINDLQPTKNNLKINIPALTISGADFYSLYHNRIFNVNQLILSSSEFEVTLPDRKPDKENNSSDKGILNFITPNFLEKLNISRISINESHFKIKFLENDTLSMVYQGKAKFSLDNFRISEEILSSEKYNLFYSDGFNLSLSNYSQDLKDGLHQLYSKNLLVSTKDSSLEIEGLSVKPKNLATGISSAYSEKKLINFNVIQAFIRNLDFNKAFNDSIFEAGSISILRPSFNLNNFLKLKNLFPENIDSSLVVIDSSTVGITNRKGILKNASVKDLLASYFRKTKVGALNIENADFNVSDIDSVGNSDIALSGKLNARFGNFYFDTGNDTTISSITYSNNLSFRLNDFLIKFNDRKYQLKMKQVSFSSSDSILTANLVRFFPVETANHSSKPAKQWSFYAPEIKARKCLLGNFFENNVANMGKLLISSPSIVLSLNRELTDSAINTEKHENEKSEITLNKVSFEQIKFEDAYFGIVNSENGIEKIKLNTKFNAEANNVIIDSNLIKNPDVFMDNLDVVADFSNLRYTMPDSLREIQVDKLHFNQVQRKADIYKFQYSNDGGFRNIRNNSDVKEFYVPNIVLTGFRLRKLILEKTLESENLKLSKPELEVFSIESATNRQLKLSEINLYEKIKKNLSEVKIKNIEFDSATMEITKLKSLELQNKIFKNIYGSVSNLQIDSSARKSQKILSSDWISGGIRNYSTDFSNGLYKLNFKDLWFSTFQNRLLVKGLSLHPNSDRQSFVEKRKKDTNLIYLQTGYISGIDFNLLDFVENKNINARAIDIYDLQLETYKNKLYPTDSVLKPTHPITYLNLLKKKITVDTLNLHNAYIGSALFEHNSTDAGIIDITHIEGRITNLTNDSAKIARNKEMVITASGYLLNKAFLNASIHYPLNSEYGEFVYGGSLDTFELKELNPFVESAYYVSIKEGRSNNINFTANANEDYATGKLRMDYDNLKIELLSKKKTDSVETGNRGLFSMVANSIIRKSNPKTQGGFFKEGRIYFERNIFKSLFNYWIGPPLSGIQSTLGFKSKQFKERLKLERESVKFGRSSEKRKGKMDKRQAKKMEKQIEKELKDDQKERRKEQKKEKKTLRRQ
ncbi:MAG: hypothetical protein U0W24_13595 [Bacteroidales bacterium]